ncbi:hypothetical protein [Synechococcus sp. WH 8016]|uniref:hypothetical protein n=1 Tax=Synechococcus sp. WH 8016 TaxID=166318 RepID=UPI00022D7D82|nr:hypothetical protein [Synechococcus sp. WH 8016]EHA63782.1 hypothetical protein Syn8016DRAFT_0823 [Synechococcus sp. WH 8016]
MSLELNAILHGECPTIDIPSLDNIKNLSSNIDDWQYVNPMLHARRLNKILKSDPIRRLYDYTSRAYAAVRRYQLLQESGYTKLPGQWARTEDELWKPEDVDSCDWRWNAPRGRPPLFWQFVAHGSCHWNCEANIEVAKRLFPDIEWMVFSGTLHSTVLAPEEKLCFDLQYIALEVSLKAGFELLFGEELNNFDEILVGTEESPYKCSEGTAGPAMMLFNMIDKDFSDRPEVALQHLRDFMAMKADEDFSQELVESPLIKPALTLEVIGA